MYVPVSYAKHLNFLLQNLGFPFDFTFPNIKTAHFTFIEALTFKPLISYVIRYASNQKIYLFDENTVLTSSRKKIK